MTFYDSSEEVRLGTRAHPRPLKGLVDNADEWVLGPLHIHKSQPLWSLGYSGRLTSTSRIRKHRLDQASHDKAGWALIFRASDRDENPEGPDEYLFGWTPTELGAEVDDWIDFLNREIRARVENRRWTVRGDYSEPHLRAALRTFKKPLEDLVEASIEGWRLGTLQIPKHGLTFTGSHRGDLTIASRFRKSWFELRGGPRGWAILFRSSAPGTLSVIDETFVGWAPPERVADVDRWIAALNTEIKARLAEAKKRTT